MATQYCYYNGNTRIKKVNFNGNTYRKVSVSLSNMTKLFVLSTWYSGTCKDGLVYQSTYSQSQYMVSNSYTYSYKPISFTYAVPNPRYSSWFTTESFDCDQSFSRWGAVGNYSATTTFGVATNQTRESCTVFPMYWGTASGKTVTVPAQYDWSNSYLKGSSPQYIVNFSYSASNVANDADFAQSNLVNYYNVANNTANGVSNYPSNHYTLSRQVRAHLLWTYIQTNTF